MTISLEAVLLPCLIYMLVPGLETSGKPLATSTELLYPYSLAYKSGEFQGDLYEGAPEGTIVSVKGTLGDKKYYPVDLGVEVRPIPANQGWVNPFYTPRVTNGDKNMTELPSHLTFSIMGSSKFTIDPDGDVMVQESQENYGLHSIVYFCVVLTRKEDGMIVSNPLSFIVEIIRSPKAEVYNKNALTAGILVLLIIFTGLMTALAVKCKNWKFPQKIDDSSFSDSEKEDELDGMDWKDHYHINVGDSVIFQKTPESRKNSSEANSPRSRSNSYVSSMSWLRLHDDVTSDSSTSANEKVSFSIPEDDNLSLFQNENMISPPIRNESFKIVDNPSKGILKKTTSSSISDVSQKSIPEK